MRGAKLSTSIFYYIILPGVRQFIHLSANSSWADSLWVTNLGRFDKTIN